MPLTHQSWKQIATEVELFSGWDQFEYLGFENIDTGVDGIADDLAPRRLFQKVRDAAVRSRDDDAILKRVFDSGQHHRGQGSATFVGLYCAGEIEIGQDVAADDQERIVQEGCRVLDRPGG